MPGLIQMQFAQHPDPFEIGQTGQAFPQGGVLVELYPPFIVGGDARLSRRLIAVTLRTLDIADGGKVSQTRALRARRTISAGGCDRGFGFFSLSGNTMPMLFCQSMDKIWIFCRASKHTALRFFLQAGAAVEMQYCV